MTQYLVFEQQDEAYAVIGQADEGDANAAIRNVAAETVTEGDVGRKFWATPLRSWRGLEVATKVVVDTKQLSFAEGEEIVEEEAPPIETESAQQPAPVGAADVEQVTL